jgi:FMN phosphatase YigB (HAD superfamily)
MICKELGIKPSDMVHVGDDIHQDFNIPRAVGISSYLLDRTGEKTGECIQKFRRIGRSLDMPIITIIEQMKMPASAC